MARFTADSAPGRRRVLFLVPGPDDIFPGGFEEMTRRAHFLGELAAATAFGIDLWTTDEGPETIESETESVLSIPDALRLAREADGTGAYEAIILGCFGSGGVGAMREITTVPVVSPAAACVGLSLQLGTEIGVISTDAARGPSHRALIRELGFGSRLAGITFLDIPISEFRRHPDDAYPVALASGRSLLDRGAETIVLGCMSLGFTDLPERLSADLGVPVINPVSSAVHAATALAATRLQSSRVAYHVPPKVRRGLPYEELSSARA